MTPDERAALEQDLTDQLTDLQITLMAVDSEIFKLSRRRDQLSDQIERIRRRLAEDFKDAP